MPDSYVDGNLRFSQDGQREITGLFTLDRPDNDHTLEIKLFHGKLFKFCTFHENTKVYLGLLIYIRREKLIY